MPWPVKFNEENGLPGAQIQSVVPDWQTFAWWKQEWLQMWAGIIVYPVMLIGKLVRNQIIQHELQIIQKATFILIDNYGRRWMPWKDGDDSLVNVYQFIDFGCDINDFKVFVSI